MEILELPFIKDPEQFGPFCFDFLMVITFNAYLT